VANIAAATGAEVALWMRNPEQAQRAADLRENARYLPGHPLTDGVVPTNDLEWTVRNRRLLFVTVPSASFRTVCATIAPFVTADDMVISGTKGIEGDGFVMMSQIIAEETPAQRVGVISGPNLAEEMATGHYTGTVIASASEALRERVQAALHTTTFRVYASSDPYGVELAGSLKNIYAIVCGIATGLGVGQNTISMLVTRSLAEMSRFAVSLGANPFTFLGLAGVGDLMATCTSPLSRNFQLGHKLASGVSLDDAVTQLGKLAEGVNTLAVVQRESDNRGVYMPLVAGLHSIVFDNQPIDSVISGLMTSDQGDDVEFALPQ